MCASERVSVCVRVRTCRAEQEAAEQRSRERAAAIVQRREAKRVVLPPAPPPGSGTPGSPTILVRVRLPDGSNAQVGCWAYSQPA